MPRVLPVAPTPRVHSFLAEPLRSRRHLATAGVGLAVIAALTAAALLVAPDPSTAVPLAATPAAQPVRIGTGAGAGNPDRGVRDVDDLPTPGAAAPVVAVLPPATAGTAAPNGPAITALAASGIPIVALQAYQAAAARLAGERPSCHLAWTLVAAIGAVESGHGSHAGAQLYADGQDLPHVIGPVLDGSAGNARIADTDDGVWDGDTVYDRAVGPMQFIPSTWARNGVDANGDGRADPFNIVDAAATTGSYLCRTGADLATDAGRRVAVFSYNHLDSYVATVLALDAAYADRPVVTTSPTPPPAPVVAPVTPTAPPTSATPTPPVTTDPTPTPTTPTCPTGTPTGSPTGSPTDTPTGTPTGGQTGTPTGCPTPTDTASGSASTTESASESTSESTSESPSGRGSPATTVPTPTPSVTP